MPPSHTARLLRAPSGGWPLSWLLAGIVLIAVVPVVVAAAVLVWHQAKLREQAIENDLSRNAAVLALALEREIASHRAMLEALAQSELLDSGALNTFHAFAKRVTEAHGAISSSLFTPDGIQVLNTLRPAGAPVPTPFKLPPTEADPDSPPLGDTATLRRVFFTGEASHSDIYRGIVAKRLLFTVDVPVVREGKVVYAVNAGFEPAVVSRLTQHSPSIAPASATIFDRKGFIIARSADGSQSAGRPAAAQIRSLLREKPGGVAAAANLEEIPVRFAWTRINSGWIASVALPEAFIAGAVRRQLAIAGGLAALSVLLGLAAALFLARGLRAAIVGVSSDAAPQPTLFRARELEDLKTALAVATRERDARVAADARREEAIAANRAKDSFIATLAHELRNPLAPILNALALLKRNGQAHPQQMWARDVIERQAGQLTRLVDDLLDVERINRGKLVLRKSRVSLQQVIDQALEAAKPHIDGASHRFSLRLPAEQVCMDADAQRLAQAISNLLINAAKYTPPRGAIQLHVERAGEMAHIAVEDTGIGFSNDEAQLLFTPFYQSRALQPGERTGLGIGLALVKTIAEMHGGTVAAQSDGHGKGSRFVLSLPISIDAAPGMASPRQDAPFFAAAPPSLHILVVDDNADAAQSLRTLLQLDGHRVDVVFDAGSALSRFALQLPDIAILDIGLPDMSGYQLAEAIRARHGAAVRLVALTGWGQPGDQARAARAGFDLHCTKPVEPRQFAARLVELVSTPRRAAPRATVRDLSR